MNKFWKTGLTLALLCGAFSATAQTTSIKLQGAGYDAGLPVEVTADTLSVDQASSAAMFEGNAKVTQGQMQLTAERIHIAYQADGAGVSEVEATGDVHFSNGAEMAEADSALYRVGEGEIALTGSVLLLQGQNTISGDGLVLDLNAGTATMQGNVKTVFTPAGKK